MSEQITIDDLRRALPDTLRFQKHTLVREISDFFGRHSVRYGSPFQLVGSFFVPPIGLEQLPVVVEMEMRHLTSDLEFEVELQTALGRSVSIFPDSARLGPEHWERILPVEIPFRGHVLNRQWSRVDEDGIHRWVMYRCEMFFDCPTHHHIARGFGLRVVTVEELPIFLEIQMRRLMADLEFEVELEAVTGCSILPVANSGRED